LIPKEEAVKFFGLQPGKKTLLIVGGSLGARSINEAIAKGLNDLVQSGLQIIWQTGKTDADKWKEAAQGQLSVWVNDFITEMEKGYAAADIVISRAGAMAKAELCVVKKPVLFVPFPFAAEDHQTVNAMNFVEKHAALMVKDNEAMDKLVPTIIELAKNEKQQAELKENIGKYAVVNASDVIANQIIESLNKNI
jgi:UDP-N-acetylglucosamine--N-acetylmuramyl-(pentapeptide) pyrophosphoryl-undecaprenol N-acetylglucosamine transferase